MRGLSLFFSAGNRYSFATRRCTEAKRPHRSLEDPADKGARANLSSQHRAHPPGAELPLPARARPVAEPGGSGRRDGGPLPQASPKEHPAPHPLREGPSEAALPSPAARLTCVGRRSARSRSPRPSRAASAVPTAVPIPFCCCSAACHTDTTAVPTAATANETAEPRPGFL